MKSYHQYIKKVTKKDPSLKSAMEFESWLFQLAINITKLRKEKGYSQEEFAEKLGMTQSAVARIESGQNMTCSTLWKISDVLDEPLEIFSASTRLEKAFINFYCNFPEDREYVGVTAHQKDIKYMMLSSASTLNSLKGFKYA